MKKRTKHSTGFKTKVVLEALQERESIQEMMFPSLENHTFNHGLKCYHQTTLFDTILLYC
jgi:hypothetical protein